MSQSSTVEALQFTGFCFCFCFCTVAGVRALKGKKSKITPVQTHIRRVFERL